MGVLALEPQGSTPPTYRPLAGGVASRLVFWTINSAPVVDGVERLILQCLAKYADPDGCNTWPSVATIAEFAGVSERTVQRRLRELVARGLIREAVDAHPPRYLAVIARTPGTPPTRWEIMMPWSAWVRGRGKLAEINAYRAEMGRAPITAANRPEIASAPPRRARADKGVPCPQRSRKVLRAAAEAPLPPAPTDADAPPLEGTEAEVPGGDSKTPLGVTQSHDVGVFVSPDLSLAPVVAVLPAPLAVAANGSGCEPVRMGENPAPAVGDERQVVRGRARAARAGAPESKRERGQATPRRGRGPARRRPVWLVSAEAVDVYRQAIPRAVKARVPDHATGRILGAITAELERAEAAYGCPAGDEVARRIAARAEDWRYRMCEAADPVGVVIGAIVRGPVWAPALRPWCGLCEAPAPARRFRVRPNGNLMRCPDCHPLDAPPPHDGLGGRPAAALDDEAGNPDQ